MNDPATILVLILELNHIRRPASPNGTKNSIKDTIFTIIYDPSSMSELAGIGGEVLVTFDGCDFVVEVGALGEVIFLPDATNLSEDFVSEWESM